MRDRDAAVRRAPAALVVVVVAALLAAGCGGSGASGAPPVRVGPGGYGVPRPLPPAAPGTVIAAREGGSRDAALAAAHRWRLTYHSTDLAGHDVAVSGMVLLPIGSMPRGGWPVVAWAHGTTGLADRCAPSVAPELGHDRSAVEVVRALLAHHWAVVASDYPGLGTPGVHPYLIGQDDARGVIDAVTAAHALLPRRLAPRWMTVGHSEGGQTALFTAQDASRRAPQWDYRGTVALAPASTLEALIPLADASADPVEQAYLVYALAGLATVDPQAAPARVLSPAAREVLPDLEHGCIDDITAHLARDPVAHVLATDPATSTRLARELGRYDDPDRARAPQAVFVAQGGADTDVPAGATTQLVARLCRLGDALRYDLVPGLDHAGIVTASLPAVTSWITTRLAPRPPPHHHDLWRGLPAGGGCSRQKS